MQKTTKVPPRPETCSLAVFYSLCHNTDWEYIEDMNVIFLRCKYNGEEEVLGVRLLYALHSVAWRAQVVREYYRIADGEWRERAINLCAVPEHFALSIGLDALCSFDLSCLLDLSDKEFGKMLNNTDSEFSEKTLNKNGYQICPTEPCVYTLPTEATKKKGRVSVDSLDNVIPMVDLPLYTCDPYSKRMRDKKRERNNYRGKKKRKGQRAEGRKKAQVHMRKAQTAC